MPIFHPPDLGAQRIDLTQVLITHPQATFTARGAFDEAGILTMTSWS
jgi:hypothetical protein